MRANSAAIQPRLRVIPRIAFWRRASVHSGNASRKLNCAVLRSWGVKARSVRARIAPVPRAAERGMKPTTLRTLQAKTYPSHSFIAKHYARTDSAGNPAWTPGTKTGDERNAADQPIPDCFSEASLPSSAHRLVGADRGYPLRLLLQQSERDRVCRP